jgi:hypothetical protein
MKIFDIGPKSPQMVLIRNLASELRFLEGRTERFEGVSVRVESRIDSVTVKIGEHERHTISYHSRDNSWTVSFHPRDPWMEDGFASYDIAVLARQGFLGSVLYSLRACKQIGGAPMITVEEEVRLLKSSSAH